ncbi:Cysteine-rich protein [Phytophthora cinnamomi]|uniref:Cysteine-rich protein n=1 Tax=Phytophthora cinnamomi TaxID=4785 RepID=UPI003559F0C6|nr:Cysteine-rich protein [Phytophthora cinnamomi]
MHGLRVFAVLLVALAAASGNATQDAAVCNLDCVKGDKCVIANGKAKCVPIDPLCNLDCVKGDKCVVENGKAKCIPIQPECTKKCPKNEKCHINADNSQCCVSPCATKRCESGYTCHVDQVQCFRAPCPPIAVCKPVKKGYGLRALNEEE